MAAVTKSEIKKILSSIPLMKIIAGPLDKDKWKLRQEEELRCLIAFIQENKRTENDWFTINCSPDGLKFDFLLLPSYADIFNLF